MIGVIRLNFTIMYHRIIREILTFFKAPNIWSTYEKCIYWPIIKNSNCKHTMNITVTPVKF